MRGKLKWEQPKGYEFEDLESLKDFASEYYINDVCDPVQFIADELFEIEFPDKSNDCNSREEFVSEIKRRGVRYGKWFHYPEASKLVRYAPQDDHYKLITNRNRSLISLKEQHGLSEARVAAIGLSVGSNAVNAAMHLGIGDHYMLFDPDRVSVSNLNRIDVPYSSVEDYKTTAIGRKISDLNPYIRQDHFTQGFTRDTADQIRHKRPDIIFEEIDDLPAKAAVRELAAELKVPLIMASDVHDKTVLSVERHDLEPTNPFNGRISQREYQALLSGKLSKPELDRLTIKIIGLRNISLRMMSAATEVGQEGGLAGIPQLGTTATLSGVAAATAARDILLGRRVESAQRSFDVKKFTAGSKSEGLVTNFRLVKKFLKYRNQNMQQKEG